MTNRRIPLGHGRTLDCSGRTLVMGILNVTPDSFSDGGHHDEFGRALAHGRQLVAQGADILDIGGESTRPGYTPVPADAEIERIEPIILALAGEITIPISVDTMKAKVADRALVAGASIVNDVWGFQGDPDMAKVVAAHGAAAVLMHNRMSENAAIDIVADVRDFLLRSMEIAQNARISLDRIILDPGIGFGKTPEQNMILLHEIETIAALGCPVLIGASRKRIIGSVTGRTHPSERLAGSLAFHTLAAQGGAHLVRVHDVGEHVDAMKMVAAFKSTKQARA